MRGASLGRVRQVGGKLGYVPRIPHISNFIASTARLFNWFLGASRILLLRKGQTPSVYGERAVASISGIHLIELFLRVVVGLETTSIAEHRTPASNMSRHEALAQLAALKSGKKRSELWQEQQAEDIYDEVDEEGYKKLLRKRLDEEDFVVDDNDLGYADDGREEWDTGPYYSDSEEEQPLKGKAAKRKAEEDKAKKENENHKIHSYFQGPAAASQKPKVSKENSPASWFDREAV